MGRLKGTYVDLSLHMWVPMLVIVLAFTGYGEGTITAADKTKIEKGFTAGKEILSFIAEKDFTRTLTAISKGIAPFLGAFGPFLGFVMALLPSADSAVLGRLKEMMRQIDNRFNHVDTRFDEIERLIDWSKVAVNFGQIEQKILAMDSEYRQLYIGRGPATNRKHVFVTHYESDFQLSGLKLYQAIVNRQGTFQENLGESVMRYTKNDRKKTRDFLLGVMRLLLQAVKIELAYYKVKGFDTIAQQRKEQWERKIKMVKSNFEQIDSRVKAKFHDQSRIDIVKYAADNLGVSNEQFSTGLYQMLNEKYYWRSWFALVYNPIAGWDNHAVGVCGGHILFRQDGRNIVVASKDRSERRMNMQNARRNLNNLQLEWEMLGRRDFARYYYNRLQKRNACAVALIRNYNADIWHGAESDRIVTRYWGLQYYAPKAVFLIMFG